MTVTEVLYFLPKMSPVILIIGVFIGIYVFKNLDALHRNILFYLVLMLAVDIASRILWWAFNNNLILFLVYSLIEMAFFVYLYNKYLFARPSKVLIVLGSIAGLYIVAEILQCFVFNTLNVKQFQPYAKVADNFIVILLALAFFYQKMNSFSESKWDNFRLNIVLLVYFTVSTIILLPFNFLVNESSGVKFYFWSAHIIMLFSLYVYLTSLMWKNGKTLRES